MTSKTLHSVKTCEGRVQVPGDKSVSHRSVILGALAQGITTVQGFLRSEDCLHTLECFKQMGIASQWDGQGLLKIEGKGLHGLQKPKDMLYVGNSGTSIRLLAGLLAGQKFSSHITGDASICQRPMKRVIDPLRLMGANISGLNDKSPLSIEPSTLRGISYESPVSSAQVKSCLLLAGLYAQGETEVGEPYASRNHTELMMRMFGLDVQPSRSFRYGACLKEGRTLKGQNIRVPADVSSAAFFMVAALITPGAKITLTQVGMNPTRRKIVDVLRKMGGKIELRNEVMTGEPVADVEVSYSKLKAVSLSGEVIPNIIDEIPILSIAAAMAEGTTEIRQAKELRVKESDRISAICAMLTSMGIGVKEYEDGLAITGKNQLQGAPVVTHGDHRIAMSAAIASLVATSPVHIDDIDCIATSFPQFFELLGSVSKM